MGSCRISINMPSFVMVTLRNPESEILLPTTCFLHVFCGCARNARSESPGGATQAKSACRNDQGQQCIRADQTRLVAREIIRALHPRFASALGKR